MPCPRCHSSNLVKHTPHRSGEPALSLQRLWQSLHPQQKATGPQADRRSRHDGGRKKATAKGVMLTCFSEPLALNPLSLGLASASVSQRQGLTLRAAPPPKPKLRQNAPRFACSMPAAWSKKVTPYRTPGTGFEPERMSLTGFTGCNKP